MLKERNSFDPVFRMQAARDVLGHLARTPFFQEAQSLLLYASYGSELPTEEIFASATWMEKKVYYPKVEADGCTMEFYRADHLDDLVEGYKGILEPDGTKEKFSQEQCSGALLLVPGAVFGKNGYRIGYGKGFYDRYLASHQGLVACGICYDAQLVEECPFESYDQKLDFILTEKRLLRF